MSEKTDDKDYLKLFLDSTDEFIQLIENNLIALESNPTDKELLHEVFRCIHTIKGDAGLIGLERISRLAHETESVLDLLRDEEIQVSVNLLDTIFEAIEILKYHIRKESGGSTEEVDDEVVIEKLHRLKQGVDNDLTDIDSTDDPKEMAQIEIHGKDLRMEGAKAHKNNEYRFVLFNLDQMTFAIPVNNIQEVVDDMPSTKVPYVEDYIEGVINLRGYIVPIISLRKRLNFVGGMDNGGQIMIVLKGHDRIGLKLDEVHSVETLDKAKIHVSEEALLGLDHTFIEGVTKKDDRLVLILRSDVILERSKLVNHV